MRLFIFLFLSMVYFENVQLQNENMTWLTETDFAFAEELKEMNITDLRPEKYKNQPSPLYNAGLFEGDILDFNLSYLKLLNQSESSPKFMSANIYDQMKWPFATVPYFIDWSISKNLRGIIVMAIQELQTLTCVRFVPSNEYRGQAVNPLKIIANNVGKCASSFGTNVPFMPQVELDNNGCSQKMIVLHELIHTLGFTHEQSRGDRDQFVTILWQNILQDNKFNFNIFNYNMGFRYLTPYDYDSIMHYTNNAFSMYYNALTIISKTNKWVSNVQSPTLTRWDVIKLNKYYHCSENLPGCRDSQNEQWCNTYGLGMDAYGNMNPWNAKCFDQAWAATNCLKTCGDCYRVLGSNQNQNRNQNQYQNNQNQNQKQNQKKGVGNPSAAKAATTGRVWRG